VALLLLFSGCENENLETNGPKIETNGPKIETLSVEKGLFYYVTFKGRVSGLENVALDFECGIEYSTDSSFPDRQTERIILRKKYSETPFSTTFNVFSGEKYYYRAYYINQLMIYYGEIKEFTFEWDAPQVTTLSAVINDAGDVECKIILNGVGDFVKQYGSRYFNQLYCGIKYRTSDNEDERYATYYNQMGDTIIYMIPNLNYNVVCYYQSYFYDTSEQELNEGEIKTIRGEAKKNGYENGHQYIELGLSVKWSSFNVGATKPEEYGDYYAWGETDTKTVYSWSTYKYCDIVDPDENVHAENVHEYDWSEFDVVYSNKYVKFNKYNHDSDLGKVDNRFAIDLEDDVAHAKWGGNWRMPTEAEQKELLDNCIWTWYSSDNTEFKGVAGYKVTSSIEGYTDRFIFIPAAGGRFNTDLFYAGDHGFYWSSSFAFPSNGCFHEFDSDFVQRNIHSIMFRCLGFSVRPVCP